MIPAHAIGSPSTPASCVLLSNAGGGGSEKSGFHPPLGRLVSRRDGT